MPVSARRSRQKPHERARANEEGNKQYLASLEADSAPGTVSATGTATRPDQKARKPPPVGQHRMNRADKFLANMSPEDYKIWLRAFDAKKATEGAAAMRKNNFAHLIPWRKLDEGIRESHETGKPLVVIVTGEDCEPCTLLLKHIGYRQADIAKFNDFFIFTHEESVFLPRHKSWHPDGSYAPRVLIVDPASGNIRLDLYNEDGPQLPKWKFWYTDVRSVMKILRKAKRTYEQERRENGPYKYVENVAHVNNALGGMYKMP